MEKDKGKEYLDIELVSKEEQPTLELKLSLADELDAELKDVPMGEAVEVKPDSWSEKEIEYIRENSHADESTDEVSEEVCCGCCDDHDTTYDEGFEGEPTDDYYDGFRDGYDRGYRFGKQLKRNAAKAYSEKTVKTFWKGSALGVVATVLTYSIAKKVFK